MLSILFLSGQEVGGKMSAVGTQDHGPLKMERAQDLKEKFPGQEAEEEEEPPGWTGRKGIPLCPVRSF